MVLRTTRGTCLADLDFGVDWNRLKKQTSTAAADCEAAIREALQFAVEQQTIRDLQVAAQAGGGRVKYAVSFHDVLLDRVRTVRGVV